MGVQFADTDGKQAQVGVAELASLVQTLGLCVSEQVVVHGERPNSRLLIGSGKTAQIIAAAHAQQADCIVFDVDLSPSQQRNWERLSRLEVTDRQEVILEIFCAHAASREATIQVELARLQYMLPRLTRAWTHLSRQRGGARGTRESGETQLEADRRLIMRKISRLKQDLQKVKQSRDSQKKLRRKQDVLSISIVGYTNTGKSSLMNSLTGAGTLVENKLFATLDPTTRRLDLPGGQGLVLTDTVGFIRKLPHQLVEAFKSTLEEVVLADYLVHVLDCSCSDVDQQWRTTLSVLHELGADAKPTLTVFNKIDLVADPLQLEMLKIRYPEAVFLSAKTGAGVPDLISALTQLALGRFATVEFDIPQSRFDLATYVHRTGWVCSQEYSDSRIHITARVPLKTKSRLAEYVV